MTPPPHRFLRVARWLGPALFPLFAAPSPAGAAGFALSEQSAAALSRAGAASASLDDAAAVFLSPAALTFHEDRGFSANVGLISARTRFSPADGSPDTRSQHQLRPVPSLFAHLRVHERVQVGLGLFAPFGFAVDWPEGWAGAESALHGLLRVLAANPVVAVNVHPTLSLAAGVSLLRGDVEMGLALPSLVGGRADLTAAAWAASWNAALFWRPLQDERLRVSLAYRAGATLPFEGDADFEPREPGYEQTLPDQPASLDLPLPSTLTLAVAGAPRSDVDVSVELTWARWSVFDQLLVDLNTFDPLTRLDSRDTLTVAAGGAYRLSSLPFVLRAGLRFDPSVTRAGAVAPSTPDSDRIGVGVGAGWRRGRVTVDLGYLYTHFLAAEARNTNAGPLGRYQGRLHALALTATLR